MGLFDKKTCAICGEKISFLGNKKLEDGDMCKECAKKLSPFFSERRHSTVESIKSQLASREENKALLDSFKVSKSFGHFGAILIDDENEQFVAIADASDGLFSGMKTVTKIEEIKDKNPDIIKFSQVEDVDIDIVETRREEKQTKDGQQVSYDPKHMLYMYNFSIIIKVKDHPYIDLMRIPLSDKAVQIKTIGERKKDSLGKKLVDYFLDLPTFEEKENYYTDDSLKARMLRTSMDLPDYSFGFKVDMQNWPDIQEYSYYIALCREVYNSLLKK